MNANPIEEYLDELIERLDVSPRDVRRVLRETEEHLLDEARRLQAEGMEPLEAEQAAVDRFGTVSTIASAINSTHPSASPLAHLIVSLAAMAAIGLCVIGVSGLLIEVFGSSLGYRYVVQPVVAGEYSASRCQDFMTLKPDAPDCQTAAMLHHYDELRDYRYVAWILGAVGLFGLWLLRRSVPSLRRVPGISQPLTWAMGTGLFGMAAVTFGGMAVMFGGFSGADGTGEVMANSIASAGGFLFCGWAYMRTTGMRLLPSLSR